MHENWGSLFYSNILQRGKEYFNKGKVKGFVRTDDCCMARVLGTHIYNVRINHMNSVYPEMSCDCAYARGGEHCKHEAAVMFYSWKENHHIEDVEMEGFSLKSDKGSTYFNVAKILNEYDVDAEEIFRAKELIESGNLVLKNTRTTYISVPTGQELVLQVTGELTGNREYPVSVRLMFSRNRMYVSDCFADHRSGNYYGYYYYDQLCVHKLALLLLADDYIAKYNPGDETDYCGSRILESFRNYTAIQKIEETAEKSRVVRLEPRLVMNGKRGDDLLSLSFRIGIEKLYVLKNINDLVEEKESSGTHKLSKSQAISFMDNDFDESSAPYYEIIKKAKSDAEFLTRKSNEQRLYYAPRISFAVKDRIELSHEILDMFYDAACGKTLELQGCVGVPRVRLTDGKMNVTVVIRQLTGGRDFRGLSVNAQLPAIIKGKSYEYILDTEKGTFSRVKDVSPVVRTFMDSADGDGMVSFTIGKKSLSEFYYRILPELMDCPEIQVIEQQSEEYQKFLPPECNIIYYLDADDNYITGKVKARYEDEEISLHPLRDSDYPLAEERDTGYEQGAVKTLLQYLPDCDANDDVFFCEKSGDNTFALLSEGLKSLMAMGEVRTTKDFEKLKIRKTPPIRLGVSVESGILNLDVSTEDMTEDELLELLESYRKNKKFFRLRNGEFIRLEQDETIEELYATMQALGISAREFTKGKLHLPLYRAIYINKLLEEHDEIASDRDSHFKSLIRNFNAVKESDIEVPKSLSKVLRSYQTYGFKWLSMLSELGFGGILADDMGLGKTIQVIALLLSRHEREENGSDTKPSLIVCPASLVYNWEEEFKRFAPEIDVKTIAGTQAERKKILSSGKLPEVLITSYDLLKRDIGQYENLQFDVEIIDEAQFIKNAQAAVSKSVKVINAVHRFALTGTPIENRLSELWSIFDYLMPGFLYTYDRFRSDFENAITKHKDEDVTKQLRNMVGPFILRRLKEDVLKDLPDKMEEVRFSRFDSAQRKLYDAQVTHMKKMIESSAFDEGKDRIKVLAELTRIRQICCDPALITEGYNGESAKRASCLELVQSAIDGGHKILLFSQFTSMFELLEKDFKDNGIEFYKITGQTRKEERIQLVHAFNENDVPLFLISLKAGGTGLNLTGADVVIHYDPWWNLAAQNQATDRAHRIGQTKKVSVFKLIVKDTIEEKIVEMQNAKKDLADAILSGESSSLMSLSREQLMELLG